MSRNKTECCVLRLGGITVNNSVYTTQSQHTAFSFVEWIVDYYLSKKNKKMAPMARAFVLTDQCLVTCHVKSVRKTLHTVKLVHEYGFG